MSSYLPGSSDYLPQLQPFQPDLNFYAGVLATKQQQYDKGLAQVNSIYGSALNSPMLRSDNIQRRDKYFQTIQQDIKKIAGLDLSVDQNISTANTLFEPILNDQNIVQDMIFTKQLGNAYDNAEQYRNCIDPDKCGGSFWEEGVQALNYAREEYQNASPDEAMRYQAPKFTPKINVTQKAIKAAKDAGFNVSYDHVEGRYMVTDTNGQILLGEKGDGVLPQFLYGMFGNDAAVQAMYSTQAYVQRKNYAKQNATQFGGDENAAESAYLNNIIAQVTPKLERSKQDLSKLRGDMKTDSQALELLAKNNGGTVPGDGVEDAYDKLQNLIQNTGAAEQYHENVSNLINTASNISDLKQLRSRADNIVANGLFMNTIQAAAFDYAMGTSKREMKADPYALAQFNNSLDISKGITLQNHEFAIWQEKEKIKGIGGADKIRGELGISGGRGQGGLGEIYQQLEAKGITSEKLLKEGLPSDLRAWGEADYKKARALGIGEDITGKIRTVKDVRVIEDTEDSYTQNGKLFVKSVENFKSSASGYLKESFDTMRQQYLNPTGKSTEEKNIIRSKILNNMTSILAGTGISPEDLIAGTVKTDVFIGEQGRFSKSIARAVSLQEKDVSSQVVTNQWSPKALAKYQVDKQIAEGFFARRKADNQGVMNELLASNKLKTDAILKSASIATSPDPSQEAGPKRIDPEKQKDAIRSVTKSRALVSSIADDTGLVTRDQALSRYIAATKDLYENDLLYDLADGTMETIVSKLAGGQLSKSAVQKATEEFDKKFPDIQNEYRSITQNWRGNAGRTDVGGASGTGKEIEFSVSGDRRLTPAFSRIEKIAKELPDVSNITFNESKGVSGAANKLIEAINSGDTKGLDFKYTLRNLSGGKVDGEIVAPKTLITFNLSDKTARELNSLNKDVDATPYKVFQIEVPVGAGSPTADEYVKNTTLNTEDVYMLQDGATLNQTLPNLGSYNITRNGQNLVFTGNFPSFNPLTGKIETREFDPQYLGNVSSERAIEIGNSLLVQAGNFTASAKRKFLTPSPQNAGPQR